MRVAVFVNSRSGPGSRGDPKRRVAELGTMLADADVDAVIHEFKPSSIAADVRAAVDDGFDAVVAAGGDGTVSAVAGLLAGTGVPLGVIPLGTLNHFARDAGVPLDTESAILTIAAGRTARVDVAEVNGRRFVNNSSIGLYPRIVSLRDVRRQRLGSNKWTAMLVAAVSVFRRYPLVRVVLETADARVPRTTPLVFVGNNPYATEGLTIGTRARLDGGVLGVYFTNRTGRFGLLRLAVRALFGRLSQAADFDSLVVPAIDVHTPRHAIEVSLDGEVCRLTPPLTYRARPGALRLLVP